MSRSSIQEPASGKERPGPRRWIFITLFGLESCLILALFLEMALLLITRNYWHDPLEHNMRAIAAHSLVDLWTAWPHMRQPPIDLLLRAYVWFPLFGVNELSLRLPDLIFGALVPLAILAWGTSYLSRKVATTTALCLATPVALFAATSSPLLFYSTYGRHYSLCALVSVLFFGHHLLWRGRRDTRAYRVILGALSVVAINTHFFFLPAVGAAYLFDFVLLFRARQRRLAVAHLAVFCAVATASIALSHGAFFYPPPFAKSSDLLAAAQQAWALLGSFYLDLFELHWLWFTLGIVAVAFTQGKKPRFWSLLTIAGPVLFAFLVYVRLNSDYHFKGRYFFPFVGLHFVFATLVCAALVTAAKKGLARLGRSVPGRDVIAIALLLLVFAMSALTIWQRRSWLTLPRQNFTAEFHGFGQVKALARPTLVLVERSVDLARIPDFYLNFLPPTIGAEIVVNKEWFELPSRPLERNPADIRRRIEGFMAEHVDGIIVFSRPNRPDCGITKHSRAGSSLFTIEGTSDSVESPHTMCLFVLQGELSWDLFDETSRRLGFESGW